MEENTTILKTNSTTARDVIKAYRKKNPVVIIQTVLSWLLVAIIVFLIVGVVFFKIDIFGGIFNMDIENTIGAFVTFGNNLFAFLVFWGAYWIIMGILGFVYQMYFVSWFGKRGVNLPVVFMNSRNQPASKKILATVALLKNKTSAKVFYIVTSVIRIIFGGLFILSLAVFIRDFIIYAGFVINGEIHVDTFEAILDTVTSSNAVAVYVLMINMIIHSIVTSAVLGGMRNNFIATVKLPDDSEYAEEELVGEVQDSANPAPVATDKNSKEEISQDDLAKLLLGK